METIVNTAKLRALLVSGEALAIRKRARLRRTELAQALGVSPSAVAFWESGERFPSAEHEGPYATILAALESAVPA